MKYIGETCLMFSILYFLQCYVTVRPLSTVGYMSVASVIHSRQWSN